MNRIAHWNGFSRKGFGCGSGGTARQGLADAWTDEVVPRAPNHCLRQKIHSSPESDVLYKRAIYSRKQNL